MSTLLTIIIFLLKICSLFFNETNSNLDEPRIGKLSLLLDIMKMIISIKNLVME